MEQILNQNQNIDITFQTAIIKNNPKKAVRSVGDGEVLETLSTYILSLTNS